MAEISLSHIDGKTLTDAEAILQRYEIALFTGIAEFSPQPEFGIGIDRFVSEQNTIDTAIVARQHIIAITKRLFPEIQIKNISIASSSLNVMSITLDIVVVPFNRAKTITYEVN